jgi:hypothetical protein
MTQSNDTNMDLAPIHFGDDLIAAVRERLAVERESATFIRKLSVRRPSNRSRLPAQLRRHTEYLAKLWLERALDPNGPSERLIRRISVRMRQAIYSYEGFKDLQL